MEKILEQILGGLIDLKTGQERLENKVDSLRSSIVKDLTPYVENVEKTYRG